MRLCDVCARPLLAGQRDRHYSCCAALGGRDPICSPTHKPHADDNGDKYKRCAVCWRQGDFVKPTTKRKAAA